MRLLHFNEFVLTQKNLQIVLFDKKHYQPFLCVVVVVVVVGIH